MSQKVRSLPNQKHAVMFHSKAFWYCVSFKTGYDKINKDMYMCVNNIGHIWLYIYVTQNRLSYSDGQMYSYPSKETF